MGKWNSLSTDIYGSVSVMNSTRRYVFRNSKIDFVKQHMRTKRLCIDEDIRQLLQSL